MNSFAREVLNDFVSLLFPNYCLACEGALVKGESIVCTRCMWELPKTDHLTAVDNSLRRKFEGRIELRYAMAFFKFRKKGKLQHLLHSLKYKNHPEIGTMLGKVCGEELQKTRLHKEFDAIIPVPLHPSRQRKRGYNQSWQFGEGLSEVLAIPQLSGVIQRKHKTETQTNRTKLSRWENVSEVFDVMNTKQLIGKHILLVDDVVTTGATLEACASQLMRGGCKDLSVACIAAAQ